MARRAVPAEEFAPTGHGVAAQQNERAGGRDAPVGELDRTLGQSLSPDELFLERFVVGVVDERLAGQPDRAAQQSDDNKDAHAVTELAHPAVAQQGQQKQQGTGTGRDVDRADDLLIALKILEQLKQEEEVPLGSSGIGLAGVGRRVEVGAESGTAGMRDALPGALLAGDRRAVDGVSVPPKNDGDEHGQNHEPDEHVAKGLIGPEPALADGVLGRGHAVTTEDEDVEGDEPHDQRRKHDHVQGIEAGERVMSVLRTADDDALQPWADRGQIGRDVGGHLRGPETLLIPRKQVAGQTEPEHRAKQREAEPPVDLARRKVGPGDHDLQYVKSHQHDHRLRAEVMQAADQPAEVHVVLNEKHAGPSRARAGTVRGNKQQAGDELNEKDASQATAPDVPPARAAGDALDEERLGNLAVTGSMIEPVGQWVAHTGFLYHRGGPGRFSVPGATV